ncbi:MAG: hypothetical protein ACLFNT_05715 [Spirochaetales bacterium]
MTRVEIQTVQPGSSQERDFIDLPRKIYAGNPYFVPWFDRQVRKIIAKEHAFFEHSDGEFFVAKRDSKVVGRIALLEPRRFNELNEVQDARFYFFESIDDQSIADALFLHAGHWAQYRGLTRLVGPQGFSSFAGAGILVHGYDRRASMTMMPYHLPYYPRLVESSGFQPLQDFHSPYLDPDRHELAPRYVRAAKIAMKRGRFLTPELKSKADIRKIAWEIRETYNNAWATRENYTPLTERELNQIVEDLLLVSKPSLIRILRAEDDLAGFVLAFPDLSEAMQKSNGKLNLLTYARLLWKKHTARHFIINGLGLGRQYRKSGGIAILFYETTRALEEHGVQGAEMTQIAADNDLMMANVTRLNADIVKTHRVYEKFLN